MREATVPSVEAMVRVSRLIRARPERVFDAFVQPSDLMAWFGPRAAEVLAADVDPRPGGTYRIEMRRPDGVVVVVTGTYACFERPALLVLSWSVTGHGRDAEAPSRVTIRFRAEDAGTQVSIVHERLSPAAEAGTGNGWEQGLAVLAEFIEAGA